MLNGHGFQRRSIFGAAAAVCFQRGGRVRGSFWGLLLAGSSLVNRLTLKQQM